MLASTIQFTTNPPTPTPHHPHKAAEHGSGNQGALPQNPDSMPPPHTQGHPPHPTPHTSRKQKHDRRVSYTKHQATNHPGPHHTGRKPEHQPPGLPRGATPAGPDPYSGPDNKRPGSHPPHNINP